MLYSEPLHLFVEIVRSGSFSRAAKKLGLATSTLTKSLTALEKDLGKILVERKKSGVIPTPVGQKLYESIVDSFKNLDYAINSIRDDDDSQKKSIKIITTTGITSMWLIPHVKLFMDKHPGIKIQIETTNESIALSKTDADVAILPSVDDPGLTSRRKLRNFVMKLKASRCYIEKNGMPKDLDDLKNHKLIGFYLSKNTFNGNVDWFLHQDENNLEPDLVINSAMCVFYATALGLGISAMSADFTIGADFIEILPETPPPCIDVEFFTAKHRVGDSIINDLYDILTSSHKNYAKLSLMED